MKQIFPLNQGWLFSRNVPEDITTPLEDFIQINLPYVWQTKAYKGKCIYRKELPVPAELNAIRLFLEFKGVANNCSVYINSKCVGLHKGGSTAFRIEITNAVDFGKNNTISVIADNSDYSAECRMMPYAENFGGVWGDVNLIIAGITHFALDDNGSGGVYINTLVSNGIGRVAVFARISNPVNYDIVSFTVYDASGAQIEAASAPPKEAKVVINIDNPVLWRPNPDSAYLYKLKVKLLRDGVILDEREIDFAFRKITAVADGIYINDRKIKVNGVTRLQDKLLSEKELKSDINNILSLGANCVRMLNLCQSENFMNFCDKKGIMIWCELPLDLDSVNEESEKNLEEQYFELVSQYYNHPSVCFVSVNGGDSPEGRRAENRLYKLLSKFDSNRLFVGSCLSDNITHANIYSVKISDSADGLNEFSAEADSFHISIQDMPILVSEYGTEGQTQFHSSVPEYGDKTEEYQALYFENAFETIARRDYIQGKFVNTLYDSDGNSCGLILNDKVTKKDSFWFLKSQWSKEAFVKIASERYKNRTDKKSDIKIYSSCRAVSLTVNGKPVKQEPRNTTVGVFVFDGVKLAKGSNIITAVTDEGCSDEIEIFRCKNPDPSYVYSANTEE